MFRPTAIVLAALIAAAPLSQAAAQDRGDRHTRERQADERRPANRLDSPREHRAEMPRISAAQALSTARARARGARFVGTMPSRGDTYVFRFEDRDGRLFDISIDAHGR